MSESGAQKIIEALSAFKRTILLKELKQRAEENAEEFSLISEPILATLAETNLKLTLKGAYLLRGNEVKGFPTNDEYIVLMELDPESGDETGRGYFIKYYFDSISVFKIVPQNIVISYVDKNWSDSFTVAAHEMLDYLSKQNQDTQFITTTELQGLIEGDEFGFYDKPRELVISSHLSHRNAPRTYDFELIRNDEGLFDFLRFLSRHSIIDYTTLMNAINDVSQCQAEPEIIDLINVQCNQILGLLKANDMTQDNPFVFNDLDNKSFLVDLGGKSAFAFTDQNQSYLAFKEGDDWQFVEYYSDIKDQMEILADNYEELFESVKRYVNGEYMIYSGYSEEQRLDKPALSDIVAAEFIEEFHIIDPQSDKSMNFHQASDFYRITSKIGYLQLSLCDKFAEDIDEPKVEGMDTKSVDYQVRRLMNLSPNTCTSRSRALNSMLWTIGNGYEWKNGGLSPDMAQPAYRFPAIKSKDDDRLPSFYPASKNNSNIFFIPDDVHDDWFKACWESFFNAKRTLIQKEQDLQNFVKAGAKIDDDGKQSLFFEEPNADDVNHCRQVIRSVESYLIKRTEQLDRKMPKNPFDESGKRIKTRSFNNQNLDLDYLP